MCGKHPKNLQSLFALARNAAPLNSWTRHEATTLLSSSARNHNESTHRLARAKQLHADADRFFRQHGFPQPKPTSKLAQHWIRVLSDFEISIPPAASPKPTTKNQEKKTAKSASSSSVTAPIESSTKKKRKNRSSSASA